MAKQRTILLVDRETDFLAWAQNQLQSPSARVLIETSADAAYKTFCLEQPEIVLAEMNLHPFSGLELLARIRALLRRASAPEDGSTPLVVADLRLDPATRRTWRGDREIELTKTEFDLLELLMRNAGIVLQHETIYERIWGYDFGPDSKNLAVYISYLRRKVDAGGSPALIRTVRGVGYTIREP